MPVEKTLFGQMPDGRPIDLYTLTGKGGMRVRVINYGAILLGVEVPDRQGHTADIALGPATAEGWVKNHGSFGATIGRYGNRIAKARFTLDGKEYVLAANSGENHIHGGRENFSQKLWTAAPLAMPSTDEFDLMAPATGVRLQYVSPDGEEGYPGTLTAVATYSITVGGDLLIDYSATTDKPTIVNLVNHSYWNLGAAPDCLEHVMMLCADQYTVFGEGLIPTGEIRPVKGTPLDFTTPRTIGAHIGETDGGYDHNLVIRGKPGEVRLAARAVEPKSGRVMELFTDQPGFQLFTANYMDGLPGKNGVSYGKHCGFCLETQRYPDSPNHANFPSPVLRPGETYRHRMRFAFSAK
jgi:aldose 1-epimerase